ncbi:restriction endonuclease subunit S [Clostridium sp.]|uniref:restriction endonuclease subunit S n=1 Tax=Clostridium sp. TaxID=1506 RepID=UPI0029068AF6|nr:restriction endonuclease subunit S [Clostridium sp.]MDU5107765.1 restriction endonuclease subunit S [Clostridium sp.]
MNIDKLKSKILQLAIQGKLTEQKSTDTPVEILLQGISESREKLIKEKKIKREKSLPEIIEEEKLFEIPKGWIWCRLGDIANIVMGQSPDSTSVSESNNGIEFHQGKTSFGRVVINKSGLYCTKPTKISIEGDVLLSVRAPVGTLNITDREICIGRGLTAIRSFHKVETKFYYYFIMAFETELIKRATGTTFLAVSSNVIKELLIPLPPLEEQKRIVAKVDELFAIIDELAENKEEMLKNISDTRNKVLQLAIQGKLVEQCENDEPVEILLQRIAEEKEKLIKEKKIKREKPFPEITEEEKLFEIPKGWEWCRLGEISTIKGGKRVPAGYKLLDTPTNFVYIRVADMKNGTILENDIKYISSDIYEKIKNYYIESNDIYITIAGTIGRVGTVPKKFNGANLTENASKIKCYYVEKEYIFRSLNSDFLQKQILDKTKKVGQPKLALNQIESLVIPIPPLEEQKRIVVKVDKIMSYLDELEKTILEEDIM